MKRKEKYPVMIVQKIFTQYRKPVFDLLYQKNPFVFLHSFNQSGIKQVEGHYSKKIGAVHFNKKRDTHVFLNIFYEIFLHKPKIIIHEFALGIVSLPLVFLLCKIFRIKMILWSHGYDRKTGFHPENSIQDKIRLFFLKISDAVILYGIKDKELLGQYIDPNKIFVALNTLDISGLLKIKNKLELEQRENVRTRIGFYQKYHLIYIGRLLYSKKPLLLLKIYEELLKLLDTDESLAVHFVGAGPEQDKIEESIVQNGWQKDVIMHGPVFDDQINGELLFCSDLMVNPGYLGLSVNHAFSFDCPVVSFQRGENGPFHSPEADYVINGETGFLIENGDILQMTKVILEYLRNKNLQNNIKNNINNFITKECTLENMVDHIADCIQYVKES